MAVRQAEKRIPVPARESDSELIGRYRRDGDREARERLIERMLPLVHRIASGYRGRGVGFEDLVQVGSVGLIKAIDRFDPGRGVKLSTYAHPNIAGEIKRHFRDAGWSVRMPRDLQELSARVARESERVAAALGRRPTRAELAEALGLPAARVDEAFRGAQGYRAASLDGEGEEPASRGPGSGACAFDQADARLTAALGARALEPREREIIYLRFFEDRTQEEIAGRVGLSQMHVSRLLKRSLEQMFDALAGGARVGAS